MHPARKETCKSANENLIFLISRILRICVRRFKGHQNGVEIFPFFFNFDIASLSFQINKALVTFHAL